jgi:hypothetical protein
MPCEFWGELGIPVSWDVAQCRWVAACPLNFRTNALPSFSTVKYTTGILKMKPSLTLHCLEIRFFSFLSFHYNTTQKCVSKSYICIHKQISCYVCSINGLWTLIHSICPSQWPRHLTRGSTIARLLALRVRIPPGTYMSLSCECCVLSGRPRGHCDGPITRPEETYRVWCVWVWSKSIVEEA